MSWFVIFWIDGQMEKNAAAGRTPMNLSMATPPPAVLNVSSSPKLAPLSPMHTNEMIGGDPKCVNSKPEPPTQFILPDSYAEGGGDRTLHPLMMRSAADNLLTDQLTERFPAGGNIHCFCDLICYFGGGKQLMSLVCLSAVTSGTLDAIRERMKSIQLSASSGHPDSGNRAAAAAAALYMNGAPHHGQVVLPNNGASDNHPLTTMTATTTTNSSMETPLGQGQGGVLPMDEKALSGLQARMERLKSGTMEPY